MSENENWKEEYAFIGHFCGGLAVARPRRGAQWTHVEPDGSCAYEGLFDGVGDFCEGLAWVRRGNEYFHIKPDGTAAYEEVFDHAESFIGGKARVRKGEKSFEIQPDGTVVEG